MKTLICCTRCKGKGQIELPEPLASTYALFTGKTKLNAAGVSEAINDDTALNAINNRLERLRALGLLKRTRDGRSWIYEKPKPGESTADPDPATNGEKPAKATKKVRLTPKGYVRVTPPDDAKPGKTKARAKV